MLIRLMYRAFDIADSIIDCSHRFQGSILRLGHLDGQDEWFRQCTSRRSTGTSLLLRVCNGKICVWQGRVIVFAT